MKANGQDAAGKLGGNGTTVISQERKPKTITDLILSMKDQIGLALPKHVTPERLTRIALTAVRQTPKLAACTQESLLGGIMQAAQLGLEPNTPLGRAYLIPRWNSKRSCHEASFQIGYQGLLELAYRTKAYRFIDAMPVFAGDVFAFEYGIDQHLRHKPGADPNGDPTHYYALYETTDGGRRFRVWSREKVLAHAKKYSAAWDAKAKRFYPGSSWETAFDAMALKTVLADLMKYAPKSAELAQALGSDERVNKVDFSDPDLAIQADYELVPEEPDPRQEDPKGAPADTRNPEEMREERKPPNTKEGSPLARAEGEPIDEQPEIF